MKNELIVWKPPPEITFLEIQIVKYGTYPEFMKVMQDISIRSLNIPKNIIQQDESNYNYSSARTDHLKWNH